MVKSGHQALAARPVAYRNRQHPWSSIEVLRLSALTARLPTGPDLERIEFHLWVVFTAGRCRHMVDFETFECRAGSVLHLRPGQVHQWDVRPGLEGFVLLLTPAFTPPVPSRQAPELFIRLLEDDTLRPVLQVPAGNRARVEQWFELLETSTAKADDSSLSVGLLRHLVAVAMLEVFRSCDQQPASRVPAHDQERMTRFKLDLERSFRVTRAVGDYARALKVSPKTLDRSVRAAAGRSAKALIDARVMLEAKRYCGHSDEPIERIAELLGFSEATNFVKFFKGHEGCSPEAFRARLAPQVTL